MVSTGDEMVMDSPFPAAFPKARLKWLVKGTRGLGPAFPPEMTKMQIIPESANFAGGRHSPGSRAARCGLRNAAARDGAAIGIAGSGF